MGSIRAPSLARFIFAIVFDIVFVLTTLGTYFSDSHIPPICIYYHYNYNYPSNMYTLSLFFVKPV